jgi:hypothetical protein
MNLNTRIQRTWIKIAAIVSAVNVLLSPLATLAGTQYWDADAGTWDTATSNWSASSSGGSLTTWTDNNDAVFSAGTGHSGSFTITVSGTRTASSLTIEEGTLTFSGGTALAIGTGGLTLNSGIGATTISTPITLGGSQSWANNSSSLLTVQTGGVTIGGNTLTIGGSGNTTISAPITVSGNITKTGSGTVQINPTDANFNTITLSGGTLKLTTPTALAGPTPVDLRTVAETAVTASSYYAGDNRPPKKVSLWDGMNKSFGDTTASSDSSTQHQWLSNFLTGSGTWIAWDLGSSRTIGSMHIWNGNEGSPWPGRGVKKMDLQTSTDGINWTDVTNLTSVDWTNPGSNQGTITGVIQGTGNSTTNTGFDWTLPSPITTRYIRFNNTFNFGTADSCTALDEVLFFTAILPVNLPTTAITATDSSVLDLTTASANHMLGKFSVEGGQTLTIANAKSVTLADSTGPSITTTGSGAASIVATGGTATLYPKADITAVSGTSLSIAPPVVINGTDTRTQSVTGNVTMSNLSVINGNATVTLGNGTQVTTLSATAGALKVVNTAGAVATVGTTDFSNWTTGLYTVNTQAGALGVNTLLKLSGVTATPSATGIFKVSSVSGSNIADNDSARTFILSGGTLTLSPVGIVGTPVDLRTVAETAVTASSYYAGDNRPPKKVSLWDGMNKSFGDTTASSALSTQYQWLSNNTTGNGTWIAWDLGAIYTIGSMHIWNGNEGGGALGRGIKTMDLETSTDGNTWTPVPNLTSVTWGSPGPLQGTITGVTQGTGSSTTNTGFDWTLPSPITTRYIRFNKTFNFGTYDTYTALDEVLFFPLTFQPVNLSVTAIAATATSTLDLGAAGDHTLGNVTVTAGASANTTLTVSNVTKLTIGTLTIGINGEYYGQLNLGAKELTLGNGSVTKLAVTSVSPTVTTCCVAVAKDGSFAGLHGTQVTDDNSKKWNVSVVDDGTMDQLWLTAASGGMIILFR